MRPLTVSGAKLEGPLMNLNDKNTIKLIPIFSKVEWPWFNLSQKCGTQMMIPCIAEKTKEILNVLNTNIVQHWRAQNHKQTTCLQGLNV